MPLFSIVCVTQHMYHNGFIPPGTVSHPSHGQMEPVSGSAHVSGNLWTRREEMSVHMPDSPNSLRRRNTSSGSRMCPHVNVAGKPILPLHYNEKTCGRPSGGETFFPFHTIKNENYWWVNGPNENFLNRDSGMMQILLADTIPAASPGMPSWPPLKGLCRQ